MQRFPDELGAEGVYNFGRRARGDRPTMYRTTARELSMKSAAILARQGLNALPLESADELTL
jgi:hypothetical protein